MIEVSGDSSRDGCWALVRLRLDGDRIADADADGLETELRGLTLLEAAAVGGETLAVDALANALGPVFRARPAAGRVAVAMSGGVDSAVALLRAGAEAVVVTLRLWTDPEGPSSERVCCSVFRTRSTSPIMAGGSEMVMVCRVLMGGSSGVSWYDLMLPFLYWLSSPQAARGEEPAARNVGAPIAETLLAGGRQEGLTRPPGGVS